MTTPVFYVNCDYRPQKRFAEILKCFHFPYAEFEDDPDLYVLKPIKYVGIEVWQVGCAINFQFWDCLSITLTE